MDVSLSSSIEKGSYEFALKLYKLLSSKDNNLIVSPFSVSNALAMVLYGARGNTSLEMSKVIFGKEISEDQHKSLAQLFNDLVNKNVKENSQVLNVGNFLYNHLEYEILADYKETLKNNFNAEAIELDFKSNESVKKINNDVSVATKGKITDLIDSIDPSTRLILVNAVYFKGLWKSQFKKYSTEKSRFNLSKGDHIEVEMMFQNKEFRFAYDDKLKFKALEMDYQDSNTSMLLLLPDEEIPIEDLESKLNVEILNELMNKKMQEHEVNVYLPRFKLESEIALIPSLKQLGLNYMFNSEHANFEGITNKDKLYVSDVIQKAVIEVNEEGTEAAAATAVMMALCASLPIPPKEFRANRPFMFMLLSKYQNNKHLILFMGAVKHPK